MTKGRVQGPMALQTEDGSYTKHEEQIALFLQEANLPDSGQVTREYFPAIRKRPLRGLGEGKGNSLTTNLGH